MNTTYDSQVHAQNRPEPDVALGGLLRAAVPHGGISVAQPANTDTGTVRRQVCHCGGTLTTCVGCQAKRCLACDPYASEDCAFGVV